MHGGFVQVDGDHVTVLAPVAERAAGHRRRPGPACPRGRHRTGVATGGAGAGPVAGEGGEDSAEADRELLDAEAAQRRAEVRLEVAGATTRSRAPDPQAAAGRRGAAGRPGGADTR